VEPSAGDPSGRWWFDPERVEGFVHGVFEGGGAKGILYVGALRGVLRRKLWFLSVAGSSAGAITAAMIAAGMEPADMRKEMDRGLQVMAQPTMLSGLRRIRWGTGFLDQEGVLRWLQRMLCDHCKALGLDVDDRGPTFAALFELTGIELFVAAVDLRARHLAVFNHALTPNSPVAQAVMASATIPVAFEPLIFQSTFDGSPRWRLFVDGGVASNYPSFVFQDEAFRRYAGLSPRPADVPVVGFLLDESVPERREETLDVYRNGTFVGPYNDSLTLLRHIAAASRRPPEARRDSPGPGAEDDGGTASSVSSAPGRPRFRPRAEDAPRWRRILRAVVRPLAWIYGVVELVMLKMVTWLGRAFEQSRQGAPLLWRWKDPQNRRARLWVTGIRSWLATAPLPLIAGVAAYTAMFWLGFVVAASYVWADLVRSSVPGFVIGLLFSLAAFVLTVWVWAFGLATFLSFRLAYRTMGILGSDVFQTYLNTSAPPWAGWGPNERLIRLRVPDGVTTLKVGTDVDVRVVLDEAEAAAFSSLENVRGGGLQPREAS